MTSLEQSPALRVRPADRGRTSPERSFAYRLDRAGLFTEVSREGERLLGYAPGELIGRHYSEIVAPPALQRARDNFERKVAGEIEATAYEVELAARDGTPIPVRISSHVVCEPGGPVGVLGVVWVAGEHPGPPAPAGDDEATGDDEPLYRVLVERGPAITYIDEIFPDGTYRGVYVSPQVERLGLSREEWLDPDSWQRRLHPDDRDWVVSRVEEGQRSRGPLRMEYRLVTAAGRVVRVCDEDAVVLDGASGRLWHVGTLVDLGEEADSSDETRVAERLLAALEERGLPAGAWLVDVEQTRQALLDADAVLRRLENAIVRSARPNGDRLA